jgi:hypothetical protein
VKKIFPWKFNLEYGGTITKLFVHVSSRNMFPNNYKSANPCACLLSSPLLWRLINFRLFVPWLPIMTSWRKVWFDDSRSWPREEKINNHGCRGEYAHIHESVCFISCEPIFLQLFFNIWYTQNISLLFFSSTEHSPESVQILGHAHIICITVRENRIICCQIFCDLLLKSAFEWIFNVMQLILVNIKWKYLIQKFHDICLSYYFNN